MSEALALPDKSRISATLKRRFFLRLHMTFILGATFAAGLITTRLLLGIHLNNLGLRYAIAVCAAYLVFLGFIRLWLVYVGYLTLRSAVDFSGDGVSGSWGGSSGGDTPSFSGGGGSGGGGGATGSWGEGTTSSGGKLDLDFGDDWGVIILIALLVLAIVLASVYVIYAAPAILSEAAFNAALAGALARRAKRVSTGGWVGSVFRATVLPFLAVLALATTTGWYAHKHCPTATRLREAVLCGKG
jgi:hypothetical protein